MDDEALNAIVEETLNRAGQNFTKVGTLPSILSEADQRLSERLHKVVDRRGGADVRFSEASALIFRKQIRLVQQYTNKRLLGLTHDQAKQAIRVSVKDTVSLAKAMEQRFRGVSQPLAIETQGWMDRATRGTNASLLQQHRTSVNRYGDRMILDFERQLRVGLLTGMSHHEIVSRLVDTGKLGGIKAAGLHRNDPRWFPEPTSYVKKRYWAERIVRTEMAYAANAANLSAMHGMRQQFPDMGKKILATFDIRTAPDSVAVHGQVRRLEEYFMDGAGRQYLHPPARPNDRETIVPWRMGWKELPATEPEQKDPAQSKPAVPPKGPEASPNSLFDDIMGANAKVKAKKAEQAAAQAKVEQSAKQTAVLVKQTAQQLKEAQAAQAAAIAKAKAAEAAAAAKARVEQARAEKLARQRAAAEARAKVEAEKRAAIEAAKARKLAEAEKRAAAKAKKGGMFGTPAEMAAVYGQRSKLEGVVTAEMLQATWGKKVPRPEEFDRFFKLPKGYSYSGQNFTIAHGGHSWRATIRRNEDGLEVGVIERTFYREDRKLKVSHDLLQMGEYFKGGSIGGSVLAHANKAYDKLGVKEISLSTAWDGKAVWAHFGFEWKTPEDRSRHVLRFADVLEHQLGLTEKQKWEVIGRIRYPRDIFNFEWNPPKEKPKREWAGQVFPHEVGRRFLNDSVGWSGKLERNEKSESYQIYKKRLASAEKKLREKGEWIE